MLGTGIGWTGDAVFRAPLTLWPCCITLRNPAQSSVENTRSFRLPSLAALGIEASRERLACVHHYIVASGVALVCEVYLHCRNFAYMNIDYAANNFHIWPQSR